MKPVPHGEPYAVDEGAGVPDNKGRPALLYLSSFWYNVHMRKNRVVEQNRCYHLISRLAHRAFFLDEEEKDRALR